MDFALSDGAWASPQVSGDQSRLEPATRWSTPWALRDLPPGAERRPSTRLHDHDGGATGSLLVAALFASDVRIVVRRRGPEVRSQPQGAERCDGRDIENDPHGRFPPRKPAVQVSRRELLA